MSKLSPSAIPADLWMRYRTQAPRYTSYPTAPHFKPLAGLEPMKAEWAKTEAGKISLYIHLPFCRSRCAYCGCHTETGHTGQSVELYLAALLREAKSICSFILPGAGVEQLALGGGTPTFLNPAQMQRLVQGLEDLFHFDERAERSIEIHPQTVDEAYLGALIALGFNRFSFGVQDLDSDVQKLIGRVLSVEDLKNRVDYLRLRGREAINVDLIYGLPGQTPDSFSHTLDRIVQIKPTRLALFGYAHLPAERPHQKALEAHVLPGPSLRAQLFSLGYDRLVAVGYEPVGMDHFALPEDELVPALRQRQLTRNFMGYTTRRGLQVIGLGASAISAYGKTYVQNVKPVANYVASTQALPWARGIILEPEDELRREIIQELMCNFYLDIEALSRKYRIHFNRHFQDEMERLQRFSSDDLLAVSDQSIRVTESGRFFIRNICMIFDPHLKRPGLQYSSTV